MVNINKIVDYLVRRHSLLDLRTLAYDKIYDEVSDYINQADSRTVDAFLEARLDDTERFTELFAIFFNRGAGKQELIGYVATEYDAQVYIGEDKNEFSYQRILELKVGETE